MTTIQSILPCAMPNHTTRLTSDVAHLLQIPQELRDIILELVYPAGTLQIAEDGDMGSFPLAPDKNLRHTCRQMYRETTKLYTAALRRFWTAQRETDWHGGVWPVHRFAVESSSTRKSGGGIHCFAIRMNDKRISVYLNQAVSSSGSVPAVNWIPKRGRAAHFGRDHDSDAICFGGGQCPLDRELYLNVVREALRFLQMCEPARYLESARTRIGRLEALQTALAAPGEIDLGQKGTHADRVRAARAG